MIDYLANDTLFNCLLALGLIGAVLYLLGFLPRLPRKSMWFKPVITGYTKDKKGRNVMHVHALNAQDCNPYVEGISALGNSSYVITKTGDMQFEISIQDWKDW